MQAKMAPPKPSTAIEDLAYHLPTGTVLIFQIMSPLFSNSGQCSAFNRVMMGVLVGLCGIFCMLACLTDSHQFPDGSVRYGWVTLNGLKLFDDSDNSIPDEEKAKLRDKKFRFGDFVHIIMSAVLFFSITLMDHNTVNCFYHGLKERHRQVLSVIPVAVGALSTAVFIVFPTKRRGVGCTPSRPESQKEQETYTEPKKEEDSSQNFNTPDMKQLAQRALDDYRKKNPGEPVEFSKVVFSTMPESMYYLLIQVSEGQKLFQATVWVDTSQNSTDVLDVKPIFKPTKTSVKQDKEAWTINMFSPNDKIEEGKGDL